MAIPEPRCLLSLETDPKDDWSEPVTLAKAACLRLRDEAAEAAEMEGTVEDGAAEGG
jgi:hypothetical protein